MDNWGTREEEKRLLKLGLKWRKTGKNLQGTPKNITVNRAKALKRQAENAAKMINDSNKKFKQCKIGDSVTLKVPDVDKGRGDFNNVWVESLR